MVHTLPPWTTKYRMVKVFGQIDSGELAARLNPINTFDRRGNVYFWDDFKDNINVWRQITGGSGSSIVLSTERPYHGASSAKLTTGSTTTFLATLYRKFDLAPSTTVGMEWIFSLGADIDHIDLFSEMDDGTTGYQVFLGIDVKNNKFTYGNVLSPTDLPDGAYPIIEDEVLWYHAKLVWNYATKKYVRFLFAEREWDMSDYSILTTDSIGTRFITLQFRANSLTGDNGVVYVGGFIHTQNEP